jgi:hypothetical protein
MLQSSGQGATRHLLKYHFLLVLQNNQKEGTLDAPKTLKEDHGGARSLKGTFQGGPDLDNKYKSITEGLGAAARQTITTLKKTLVLLLFLVPYLACRLMPGGVSVPQLVSYCIVISPSCTSTTIHGNLGGFG